MTIMMMKMMIMTDPFTTNLVVKGPVVKGSVVKGATSIMIMKMLMVIIMMFLVSPGDENDDWSDENIEDTDHNDGQSRPIDQRCQLQREQDQSLKVNQHLEGIIKRRGNIKILHYYVFLVSD